jgi:hypothetical protein
MSVVHLSSSAINAACNAVVDLLDAGSGAGTILVYSGTMPDTPEDSPTVDNVLLATLTFNDPAFNPSDAGSAAAATITSDTSADYTGTAAWARLVDSDDNVIMDCDVATAGAAITLLSTNITAGDTVSISSFVVTVPSGV